MNMYTYTCTYAHAITYSYAHKHMCMHACVACSDDATRLLATSTIILLARMAVVMRTHTGDCFETDRSGGPQAIRPDPRLLQLWLTRRCGGCAPLHRPAFWGAPPPGPPKKALRALGCNGLSLSRDRTTCPGQNCFQEIRRSLKKPLVWGGSFAAWGRTGSRRFTFFRTSYLSRAASLPGAELFP